jgi:hypothetical protein
MLLRLYWEANRTDQTVRLADGPLRNAFTLTPGRCFRLVTLPGVGHPDDCREPVEWRGRWRAASGKLYRVEACAGHVPADDAARAPQSNR